MSQPKSPFVTCSTQKRRNVPAKINFFVVRRPDKWSFSNPQLAPGASRTVVEPKCYADPYADPWLTLCLPLSWAHLRIREFGPGAWGALLPPVPLWVWASLSLHKQIKLQLLSTESNSHRKLILGSLTSRRPS